MDSNSSLEYTAIIKNTSVVDAVKDWIIDQLIKGNLRPGDKLPTEAELRENLGASRNSVREAIKQLEAYGVLYIKRAEGTFVTDSFNAKILSPVLYSIILQNNHWEDFVDLRRAIDIGTLYVLLNRKLAPGDLAGLRRALDNLELAVGSGTLDVEQITQRDCDFHNEIIRLTGNPQLITLSDYVNRITVPSRESTTEKVIASGQIDSYIRLHRQLYNIIAAGDKSSIESAVMDHYYFWQMYTGEAAGAPLSTRPGSVTPD